MSGNNKLSKRRIESSDEDNDGNAIRVSSESEENGEETTTPFPYEIIYSGLVLKKEYVLLKKIGFGNNAGVWMTYQISTQSYFAIKIQDYKCYQDGCREVAIIKKINDYSKTNKNKNFYCVKMLDFFVYEEDEETKYVCSIYDLYAGSVQELLNDGKYKYGLPIPIVKKIIKQLLTALETLHGQLEIIHTDIKPENILYKGIPEYHEKIIKLFTESDFQKKYEAIRNKYIDHEDRFMEELDILALDSVKTIYKVITSVNANEEFIPDDENYDEDDIIEGEDDDNYSSEDEDSDNSNTFNEREQSVDDDIESLDYCTMHDLETEVRYETTDVLNNRINSKDKDTIIDDMYVQNCQIALTDFGNSYFFSKRTRNEIQDRRYRAPEVILDFNYKYACDIWSVSCVTFELLTGFVLFEPLDVPINRDIHHLFLMERYLGKIPLSMKKASKRNRFLFDKKRNYHIKNVEPFKVVPLRNRLVKQFLFTESEADEINDFIMCGLIYNPNERLNASEMLKHPWLTKL